MFFTPPTTPPIKPPVITVWIHGTKVDECLPTPFAKIAKALAPIIFEHKPGINPIASFNQHHYEFIRAQVLGTTMPSVFNQDNFYVFGWSGKLNLAARKQAAHDLFCALKPIVTKHRETYGVDPDIILISHSHGGNVILHLAEITDPDGFSLHINKAILLACPVQKHTNHLISSKTFDRIYSIHSHTDVIQIVDPQGLHIKNKFTRPLLSCRHFDAHPKLAQVAIKWKQGPILHLDDRIANEILLKNLTKSLKAINYLKKNRGLFHIEFQLLPFMRQLPGIIILIDELFETNANCQSHKDHDIVIEL